MAEQETAIAASRRIGPLLAEVFEERRRQDAKWGQQNHADGTDYSYHGKAMLHRHSCEDAFRGGLGTWRHILAEEVYEAFEQTDPVKLREELIQVAAVAVAWAEAIDRREPEAEATDA